MRFVIVSLLMLMASAAEAAPSLYVEATQEARRPDNFTAIPMWEPVWWINLSAKTDGAPLRRVEYRATFNGSETRPNSGGWDVGNSDRDGFVGRVRVTCNQLADYDTPVKVRVRLVDANGDTSEWMVAEFPPEYQPKHAAAPAPTLSPKDGKAIGTVSYVAGEEMSLADVRSELLKQARAQGGNAISELQMVELADARTKFWATALQQQPNTEPTAIPTVSARRDDRVLAEIKMGARRR